MRAMGLVALLAGEAKKEGDASIVIVSGKKA
jgi:hypothetical protein